jgi:hypothetical protein
MAFRLYLVPVIGAGTSPDPRRPKYFDTATVSWAGMDYGFEPWMLVGADLAPADDAALVAQPDAMALPFDLSPTLTAGQVTTVQTKLEAANLPAGWVTTALTWRAVVRIVCGMFQFLQRYGRVFADANGFAPPSIFGGTVTLNTTFGALPAAVQNALVDTAISFEIPTTGLTAGTTLRTILRAMADHFDPLPLVLAGVAI